jgi:hypothetical protein
MGTWILRLAGFAFPKKLLAILGLGAVVAVGASYSLYKASVTQDKVIALEKALSLSEARLKALEGVAAEQAEVLRRHTQVKERQNAVQSKVRQAAAGPGPVDHARVQRAAEEARRALRGLSESRQGSSPTRVSGTP